MFLQWEQTVLEESWIVLVIFFLISYLFEPKFIPDGENINISIGFEAVTMQLIKVEVVEIPGIA